MTSATCQLQTQCRDDKFREYKPYARGNAARITEEQWEPYLPLIRCLHHARRTRVQIVDVLREQGFEPSVAQLYAKMSKWGLKGYGVGQNEGEQAVAMTTNNLNTNESITTDIDEKPYISSTDRVDDSSEESEASYQSKNCFSNSDPDTSDTVYETESPPISHECTDVIMESAPAPTTTDSVTYQLSTPDELAHTERQSSVSDDTISSSSNFEVAQKLPADLMDFVQSTNDLSEFDRYDILNEVACFLCATSSFSDAFVLFDASCNFLKANEGSPMALVFATINCLRSATFREQCQYAGSLMGEALGSLRLLSYTNPYAATAFSSLEEIGRELCVKSELYHLNILYTQMQFRETSFSANEPSRSSTNEILLHCSDPFLLAKSNDRPEMMTQSIEASGISLGRIVKKLSRWCCSEIADFNPISMLPSAGFNPSDPTSVARFATALSCHFIRKWSFLSLSEVLANCNELLPPNRKDAAARLCKLAVRVLSTLAVYTIYQATGVTLRSVSRDRFVTPENQAQYISPLASHLDILSRMRNRERVAVFAEMHKTLYNRTLVYRQQMDDHCLTAHVRETGFLLAASLVRLKRELNSEVPRPAFDVNPARDSDSHSHSPSRKSSDSSSSMRNLARRNMLVPGIMSKNGSHVRSSWMRRLSTGSNESWNFTTVTGLPAGPTPPESIPDPMSCDDNNDSDRNEFANDHINHGNENENENETHETHDMMDTNMI